MSGRAQDAARRRSAVEAGRRLFADVSGHHPLRRGVACVAAARGPRRLRVRSLERVQAPVRRQKGANCAVADDGRRDPGPAGQGVQLNVPRNWNNAVGVRVGPGYWIDERLEAFGSLGIHDAGRTEGDDRRLDDRCVPSLSARSGAKYDISKHFAIAGSYNHIYFFPVNTNGANNQNISAHPTTSPGGPTTTSRAHRAPTAGTSPRSASSTSTSPTHSRASMRITSLCFARSRPRGGASRRIVLRGHTPSPLAPARVTRERTRGLRARHAGGRLQRRGRRRSTVIPAALAPDATARGSIVKCAKDPDLPRRRCRPS